MGGGEAVMMSGLEHRPFAPLADVSGVQTAWLLCRAGYCRCAIPLDQVIESMRVLPIETIAGAPAFVRGMCIIRGAPVLVVDAGLILSGTPSEARRLVSIRTGRRTTALMVDDIVGIRHLSDESLDELPPLLQGAASDSIATIAMLDNDLLYCLHMSRVVPADWQDRFEAGEIAP